MFHVGQHVLCVDDFEVCSRFFPGSIIPRAGVVYTIREIVVGLRIDGTEAEGLCLEEIRNGPQEDGGEEVSFESGCFRPLSSRSLDVFTAMLAPRPRQPAHADLSEDERRKVNGWEVA